MNDTRSHVRLAGLAGLAILLAACVSPVEEARQKETAETQVGLAQAYLQQNDVRQAMPVALKAVELDPQNLDAQLTLGRIYHMEGRWDQALEAYQKALALDPANRRARELLKILRVVR